jgi:cation diffusion facilitator family transporter
MCEPGVIKLKVAPLRKIILAPSMIDSSPATCCGCHTDEKRAASDPAYRRALWMVVGLNLSFGLVEMIGGFFARSQALKADALDFLGDGSITLLGLFALAWAGPARARVALTQGAFLAALALSVIGAAVWRATNAVPPEAHLMGGLGVVGLFVNISAALVLMRFREGGDANARAIWLFSRNDALANIAVVIAAVLVSWLGTAWPDLAVAVIIALLFLHSAREIIRDAWAELRDQSLR